MTFIPSGLAVVGAGSMAEAHLKACSAVRELSVTGIYSRTSSRAEKLAEEFRIGVTAANIAQLFDSTKASFLLVAVSELSTIEVLEEAVKFPWTILVEKPVGLDVESSQQICEYVDTLGGRVFVGMNRRHYSSVQHAHLSLNQHAHQQRLIQVIDQEDPRPALAMGRDPRVIRQWMYANSIHLIDLLRYFARGRITSVESATVWQNRDAELRKATVTFDSGDIATYEGLWNTPGPWSLSVTSGSDRWHMAPLETLVRQRTNPRGELAIPASKMDMEFKPGLVRQLEELHKAGSGLKHSLPNLADALESMELVKLIYSD